MYAQILKKIDQYLISYPVQRLFTYVRRRQLIERWKPFIELVQIEEPIREQICKQSKELKINVTC